MSSSLLIHNTFPIIKVVRLDAETKISENLSLAFFTVRQEDKIAALFYLLKTLVKEKEQTIIFTATKHHVELITELMKLQVSLV